MRLRTLAGVVIVSVGCFASRGRDSERDATTEDGGIDSSSTDDTSAPDARPTSDGSAISDGSGGDDWLPGFPPPPDRDLPPGSTADLLYQYCWYSSVILCEGVERCCEDPLRGVELLGPNCAENIVDAICANYVEHPEEFDERIFVDEELIRGELERFRANMESCEPYSRTKPFEGNLEEGAVCEFEGVNESFFCAGNMLCAADDEGVRRCTPPAGRGEPCGGGCTIDLTCSDGICGDLLGVGEPCTSDGECESRRCGRVEDDEPPNCLDRSERAGRWCFWFST